MPEKIHAPTTEGMLENLTGGELNSSGNSDWRETLNLKIHHAFWVSRQNGHQLGLILHCTLANHLANHKEFLRQIAAGCEHNSAQLDKWLEILAVKDLTRKEQGTELQGEQRRRPQCIHRQPI